MIRMFGDPVLRTKCEEVDRFDSTIRDAVEALTTTFRRERAFAVAAPQVGLHEQLFVWGGGGGVEVVANPVILEESEEPWKFSEGCLSMPGQFYYLDRPRHISVEYTTLAGGRVGAKLSDIKARIFQHELDHLQGILLVDRLTPPLRKQALRKLAKLGLAES